MQDPTPLRALRVFIAFAFARALPLLVIAGAAARGQDYVEAIDGVSEAVRRALPAETALLAGVGVLVVVAS
jgi:hypothetical protein